MELPYEVTLIHVASVKGWIVVDILCGQLASVHIYETREECQEVARGLNEAYQVKANWPEPNDPEVIDLINDQSFIPVGQINVDVLTSPVYRLHQAAETIARKRAGIGQDASS